MWCISTRLKLTRARQPDRGAARNLDPRSALVGQNQARMHFQNGDPPYADLAEAVRHWPETCTAIAARTLDARIELLAPFGVDDLISLVVQPTPAFANKIEVYRARVARKAWQVRWPKLRTYRLLD
jgi:uncharacterized protein